MAELGSSYFEYRKHKTDFKTEVIAGVTTFLTMAYIMFLNPIILADGGFDFGGVFTATILSIAVACFIMGFYGKTWPIGLAPGMGLNAFVAYGVCLGMGHTPAEALGAVLVAGVLFVIISLTPIRAWIINSIPKSLKLGIGAGIGLFLAIIGLEIMGVVADHPVTLVTLGNLKSPIVLLGALAFVVMIVLEKLNVNVILNNNKAVNLLDLIGLIKNSSYVISNDTGPAHIAAHLNKKGLVLFGSHTTAEKVSIETKNFQSIQVKNLNNLYVSSVLEKVKENLN